MRPSLTLITILTLLGTFWGGYVLADCIQDPVGYWTLDQDTQPYADEILDGTAGTCTPALCPAVDDNGVVGSGQSFDGIDDGIVVEDTGTAIYDRTATDSFSIGVWFRREAAATWTGNEVLIGRYDYRQTHFWVGLENTTGRATFRLWDDAIFSNLTAGRVTGTTDIADGQWHFVMAVRNGQTNQNILYVDGIEEGSLPITYTGDFTGDAPMTFGRMNNDYYLNGSIDEVYYFDEIVAADVAGQMYDAGSVGNSICSDNLPPEITSIAPTSATVGVEYRYAPTATDPDGNTLTWHLESPVSGMQIDEATGVITWTPTAGTTTSGQVTLVVTDGFDSDEEVFSIIVSSGGGSSSGGSSSGGGSSGGDSGGDSGSSGGCFIEVVTAQESSAAWLKISGAITLFWVILFSCLIGKKKRCQIEC